MAVYSTPSSLSARAPDRTLLGKLATLPGVRTPLRHPVGWEGNILPFPTSRRLLSFSKMTFHQEMAVKLLRRQRPLQWVKAQIDVCVSSKFEQLLRIRFHTKRILRPHSVDCPSLAYCCRVTDGCRRKGRNVSGDLSTNKWTESWLVELAGGDNGRLTAEKVSCGPIGSLTIYQHLSSIASSPGLAFKNWCWEVVCQILHV